MDIMNKKLSDDEFYGIRKEILDNGLRAKT